MILLEIFVFRRQCMIDFQKVFTNSVNFLHNKQNDLFDAYLHTKQAKRVKHSMRAEKEKKDINDEEDDEAILAEIKREYEEQKKREQKLNEEKNNNAISVDDAFHFCESLSDVLHLTSEILKHDYPQNDVHEECHILIDAVFSYIYTFCVPRMRTLDNVYKILDAYDVFCEPDSVQPIEFLFSEPGVRGSYSSYLFKIAKELSGDSFGYVFAHTKRLIYPYTSGDPLNLQKIDRERKNKENKEILSLNKDEFTFTHIELHYSDGEDAKLIVAPLKMSEPCYIAVWVKQEENANVYVTEDVLKLQLGNHIVSINGKFNDSSFEPVLSYDDDAIPKESRVSNSGKSGHVITTCNMNDETVEFHVFPLSFNNNQNGYADYFYVINKKDKYVTGVGPKHFTQDNKKYILVANWNGDGMLHTVIMPDTSENESLVKTTDDEWGLSEIEWMTIKDTDERDTLNEDAPMKININKTVNSDSLSNYLIRDEINPVVIKKFLDHTVIGQEEAKISLSVALSNHIKIYEENKKTGEMYRKHLNQTTLVIGPSGSGKTMLAKRLGEFAHLPVVIMDASQLTADGWAGADKADMLEEVFERNSRIDAEHCIVVLDEFDKFCKTIKNNINSIGTYSRKDQSAILGMLDGIPVMNSGSHNNPNRGKVYNTKNMLFILTGSFSEMEDSESNPVGFGEHISKETSNIRDRLIDFGLLPELVGRITDVVFTKKLTEDEVYDAVMNSEESNINLYKELVQSYGKKLRINKNYVRSVIMENIENGLGVRGARNKLDEEIRKALYCSFNDNTKEVWLGEDDEEVINDDSEVLSFLNDADIPVAENTEINDIVDEIT